MPNLPYDLLNDDTSPEATSGKPAVKKAWRLRFAVLAGVVFLLILGIRNMSSSVPKELGVSNGQLAPLPPSPNGVSSQAERDSQRLAPFPLKSSPQESLERIAKVCQDQGGEVVTRDENYLHVIFRTTIMRYTDDVEFLATDEALHFRSKSRVGHWDLGVNRRRIERLRKAYNES